jgi:glycosyltransferase involved in cell wall biosynthesis
MSARDTLLIITTSFPQRGDGSEAAGSFVADLAAALSRQVPVRVVAPGPAATFETLGDRLTVYRYLGSRRRLSTLRLWRPAEALSIATILRAGDRATRAATADGRVAYTLALWALPSGYWARSLKRRRGVPYAVWMLGSDIWSLGRIPVVRFLLGQVIRAADRRYADGFQLAHDGQAIARVPVEFLPSTRAIQTGRVEPLANMPPYRLVFLGRWHPNKGPDLLLDALALLGEDDWRRIARVDIHGGGQLEGRVREGAESLVAAGRPVMVGGFLDKPAAERALLDADYLIIPSRKESIPVVFSDAMKLACPVVCMPVGDLPRLLREYGAGICATHVTAAALAAAIREAISRRPSEFGVAVRNAAARFDLESGVVAPLLTSLGLRPAADAAPAR